MPRKKYPGNFEDEMNAPVELDGASIASRLEEEKKKALHQQIEETKRRQRVEQERQLARLVAWLAYG